MAHSFWGKKLGMTQIFSGTKVVPVTVIDVSNWFVLGFKTKERDGYDSSVIGRVRKRFEGKPFETEWLKKLKPHFGFVKEIKLNEQNQNLKVGQPVNFYQEFEQGATIDVVGVTKGCGFAGVVKRHGFSGGPKSHGSTMGRRTGSIGFMCKCGKVIKGKKMPGHMGVKRRTIQNLELVRIEKDEQVILVKGSIPGKSGSVVLVQSGVKA